MNIPCIPLLRHSKPIFRFPPSASARVGGARCPASGERLPHWLPHLKAEEHGRSFALFFIGQQHICKSDQIQALNIRPSPGLISRDDLENKLLKISENRSALFRRQRSLSAQGTEESGCLCRRAIWEIM